MIEPVSEDDLPAVRALIGRALRAGVVEAEDDVRHLLGNVDRVHRQWRTRWDDAVYLKLELDGRLAGVVLVKSYWNLVNLFVEPECQRRGVGTQLLNEALKRCRAHGGVARMKVNSSARAVGFYLRHGFRQCGPEKDLPGGCVPMARDL